MERRVRRHGVRGDVEPLDLHARARDLVDLAADADGPAGLHLGAEALLGRADDGRVLRVVEERAEHLRAVDLARVRAVDAAVDAAEAEDLAGREVVHERRLAVVR